MGKIKVCPVCGTLKGSSSKESRYCKCEKLKIMNPITETLEKFNNGEQRYEDDQNFKEAVDSLAAKIGVYAVLDKTLNQLRVLRGIHAKTIEGNMRLAEEGGVYMGREYYPNELETLRAQVKGLLGDKQKLYDENIRLTERLRDYESR